MSESIFWYDFETTGIDPRSDRPMQVAGIRTTESLEEIGEPVSFYCRLADDILPHPIACLVTGITPGRIQAEGLGEAEFMARLHAELSRPGTCAAGYNSLRFDDEVTRYSLYRNFYDPYAREWQGGNSRWDLIDLVRTAYALRPEGLVWPEEEGRVTLRLERLSAANRLEHLQAHDALSDVRATIGLARLIRQQQPKLYDYLYRLRRKSEVLQQIRLLEPLVHVSGRFSAERHFLAVVMPLAWHPVNRNALIVCDLGLDCSPLWQESADTLRARLYTPRNQLAEAELPVPLKLVHVNRCPVLAPMKVLREADIRRLNLDLDETSRRAAQLRAEASNWQVKLATIYAEDERTGGTVDPEQQLYAGFLGERDRRLCDQLRAAGPEQLAGRNWAFDDSRLEQMLFRYRARNFPESLSAAEQQQWREFCRLRLSDASAGAPNTLASFFQALDEAQQTEDQSRQPLLSQWREYAVQLARRFELPA